MKEETVISFKDNLPEIMTQTFQYFKLCWKNKLYLEDSSLLITVVLRAVHTAQCKKTSAILPNLGMSLFGSALTYESMKTVYLKLNGPD